MAWARRRSPRGWACRWRRSSATSPRRCCCAALPIDAVSGLSPSSAIPLAVRKQAVTWLVELQSATADEDTHRRWRQWRDADLTHAQAWARVAAFGDTLQSLPPHIAQAALQAPSSAARRKALKTLALLIGVGGAGWLTAQTPWRAWSADHVTGVGERATLALEDGTEVQMNAGSALNVRYTAGARRLQLLRGEILVTTARDPQGRPFSVDTEQGNARALGTRYLVRQLADHSAVTVFEGAVELRPARAGQPRRIEAGQQASYSSVVVDPPQPADDAASAWVDGMLVAQDMPLPVFLEALDRYREGRLYCAPDAAHLTVSGTYPLADADRVLALLQTTLPVTVDHYTRYWTTVSLKKIEKK
ncbi:DUF4880 domain-containing protein [Duganella sp. FT94W]|uniref:DUF4880 domain-containing protein n=1 Tax=Duganella lactea TaxID=2692173 RepID=A0ABW9V3F4_9BURK|nr:FecR domain-containing protein [Duganella lactea]MYM33354.1 DUF4880 domain-containing protein [Duganella lactea]